MIQRIRQEPEATAGAGLEALAAEAASIEGAAALPGTEPAPPPPDTAAEVLQALELARSMAAPTFGWWREFERVWSDAALRRIAEAGAAVMERHGWTVGDLLGAWGPYIALIAAAAPPSIATYAAIKGRDVEAKPAPAPEPEPGA